MDEELKDEGLEGVEAPLETESPEVPVESPLEVPKEEVEEEAN